MCVAREQRVPIRAPQHLDDVPARAREQPFELLDDLAVAAHRSVEALQIAVDDEGQIVELLACGEREAAIDSGSSISPSPNTPQTRRPRVSGEAAIPEIAHESRLIDGIDGSDAHRAGRKLPELRHQPGMRIGAQSVTVHFPSVVRQLLLGEAAFEERPRVHTGGRMRLKENQIAAVAVAVATERSD